MDSPARTLGQTQEQTQELSRAIDAAVAGSGTRGLREGVDRLITAYRSGQPPERPVLATRADVLAYAAYRMPATAAATATAVRQLVAARPGWAPTRLLDLGAGTGAATWATAALLPGLSELTLLEQSAAAVEVGRGVFGALGDERLRSARWQSWRLPDTDDGAALPPADLAVAAYLLGELTVEQAARLTRLAAAAAEVVLLVEPGTPAGYRRVLAARDQLIADGATVAAPCPHDRPCPLAGSDWCHFGERVARSAVHRRAKDADLSFEDEKYSFVAAVRTGASSAGTARPAARVLRRPVYRPGLVQLELCEADGRARQAVVSKKKGPVYRQARDTRWGDPWPPVSPA